MQLTELDIQALPEEYQEKHVDRNSDLGKLPLLATKEWKFGWVVCVAFRGDLEKYCECTIYDNRPKDCRSFKAGGTACQHAIRGFRKLMESNHEDQQ